MPRSGSRNVSAGLLAAVLLSALAHSAQGAEVTFADGEFSDWTSSAIFGPPNGQVSSAESSGGNPGDFLSVTTVTNDGTITGHFNPSFVYDPAGGAINSIEASLDYRNITSFGAGHGVGPIVLEQNGSFFEAGSFTTGASNFSWQTFGPTSFGPGDFTLLSGSGVLDFSILGAPIALGFRTANTGGDTINVGFDNFSAALDVTAVPVPAGLPLLATAIGVLVAARRRRGRRLNA